MGDIFDMHEIMLDEQRSLRNAVEESQLPAARDNNQGRVPTLLRIEDLLLRLLSRSGDSEILEEMGKRKEVMSNTTSSSYRSARSTSEGGDDRSYGRDTMSSFSDEQGLRAPAPPGSLASDPRSTGTSVSARMGGRENIPSSLLVTTPRIEGELDEDWELDNLPRGTPPPGQARHRAVPPDLSHLRRIPNAPIPIFDDEQEPFYEESPPREPTPLPEEQPRIQTPLPPRPIEVEESSSSSSSSSSSEGTATPRTRPHHPGPPPQQVGIPSPVHSAGRPPMMPGSFRPMPGPSLLPRPARLAGTREPMTTT